MSTDLSLHVLSRLEELRPDFISSIESHDILSFYTHVGRNRFLQCLARSLLETDLDITTTRTAEDRIHRYVFLQEDSFVGTSAIQIKTFEAALKRPGAGVLRAEHCQAIVASQLLSIELNLAYGHPCFDAYALGGLLELDEWMAFEALPRPFEIPVFQTHLELQLSKAKRYTCRVEPEGKAHKLS